MNKMDPLVNKLVETIAANPTSNSPTRPIASNTLSWSGTWRQSDTNRYISSAIGDNQETWQTLTINAPSGGIRLNVRITASSEANCDFGYATNVNGFRSSEDYQLRVSGTENGIATYDIPSGIHNIHFGYKKDSSRTSGNDNVIVEVIVE